MNNIEKLICKIKNYLEPNVGKIKSIGLQLPDGLKYWVHEISDEIEKLGFEVTVSSSHTYGACDIDTNLLKEVELLLHIAHYPVVEIPKVVYIPYEVDYEPAKISNFLNKVEESDISLISTAQYLHKILDVKKVLEAEGFNVRIKKGIGRCKRPGYVLGCNYTAIDCKCEAVLFVGDGAFHPKGAAIYSKKKVYAVSPLTNEFKIFDENEIRKFIVKRYSKILKCEECKRFCVFVSSKPGQKRLKLAKKLKSLLKQNGKKCTLVYCDDFDFSNFVCDCLINTACPRIAYDDHKEATIITPQELEILLKIRGWEDYKIDILY